MNIKRWEVPIHAEWYRSNELKDLCFDRSGVMVRVKEEDSGGIWNIRFNNIQAFRSTTEECAIGLIKQLPQEGGFFEVQNSSWIDDLGRAEIAFLEKSRHFVIGCYDEIIEVVAWEAIIEKSE